ncbi:hypothetical protein Scep_030620 [Stephania cephalantha]|uniref:CW-type domain-containing protein n=1 Tax=Stephania cephalantha TaxID=152367 RepID=A0AAP0HEI1_9MAGN
MLGQSPTVILQEMTSIPVPGGCLLSPLPMSFLHLTEREAFQMDTRICFAQKCSEDGSAMASYESPARMSEKGSVNVNNGDPWNGFLLKKDVDIEILDESCKTALRHIGTGTEKHTLKTCLTSTVWENENSGLQKDACFKPSKKGKHCINRSDDLDNQKVTPNRGQPDIVKPHQRMLPPSGSEKKSEESLCNVSPAIDYLKENLKSGSSTLRKVKKKRNGDHPSRSEPVDKLFKESEKNRERHVALFDDNDEAEKRLGFSETQFTDGLNDADNTDERGNSSSEKFNDNLTTVANPKAAPDSSLTGSEPVPEVTPVATNTVLINEDWVCCDSCGKWRLLPYGTNAEALQQSQWLCSMLTWLPGMNRCEISEDETTKALEELYFGNRSNPQSHVEGPTSGISLGNLGHPGQNHSNYNFPAIADNRKKKQKVKEASNVVHSTNLTKKNQQTSLQITDNVQQSPLAVGLGNKANFQNLSKSASIDIANKRYKLKGDTKPSKVSGKREASLDESRASKKIKRGHMGALDIADGDWSSDRGENMRKVIGTNNGIRDEMVSKDLHKHKYSLKDAKCDRNDRLSAYPKKKQDQPQASFNGEDLGLGNNDKMKISAQKRKVKHRQESEICPPPVSLSDKGRNLPNSKKLVMEVSVESEFHKGEASRLFKTEGKESRTSKGESKPNIKLRAQSIVSEVRGLDGVEGNRKSCIVKRRVGGPHKGEKNCSHQPLEGTDSLRRERCGQISVCTTSSSSKISGSHKSKPKFQDIKCSPVDSVSSSPVRLSNYTKVMPTRSNLTEKDGMGNVGVPIMSSSGICYDGEGNGAGDQSGTMWKEKAFSVHSSMVGSQHKHVNYSSRGKDRGPTGRFSAPESDRMAIACKEQNDHLGDEMVDKEDSYSDRVDKICNHSDGSVTWKSGHGFLQRREKHGSSKSSCDRTSLEVSNLSSEQEGLYSTKKTRFEVDLDISSPPNCPQKSDGKYIYQENFGANSTKGGRDCLHKHSAEKCLYESRKEDGLKSGGPEDSDVKVSSCITDGTIDLQHNQNDFKGASDFSSSDRTNVLEAEQRRGKLKNISNSVDAQEISLCCRQHIDEAQRGNVSSASSISAIGDIHEAEKPLKLKLGNRNGAHSRILRPFTGQTVDASGLVRRDSCSQIASNALKEATDLKHEADRLKNAGAELQSTKLYFRAALKFLHGASRLEPCDNESAKPGEMTHSMLVYSDTARLCEFVAREYERCKEMAAAALAYKCMEVAYMQVVYSKQSCLSRDRHELQTALEMVPPGESPSSSASDIDNFNNQASVDKVIVKKGANFYQGTGDHVIIARNRPSFTRLLNFAQDAIFAMEASRKSHSALAASRLGQAEALDAEAMSSVKKAIDFNFHDIEGLLRLVRMAMEAINH